MSKKIVWIDMDGVLVDFAGHVEETIEKNVFLKTAYKGRYDHIPGIFRNPKPVDGAVDAIKKLAESGKYELYIS